MEGEYVILKITGLLYLHWAIRLGCYAMGLQMSDSVWNCGRSLVLWVPGTSGSIGNGILGEYFPEREYNLLGPKKTRKRPKFQPWQGSCEWFKHDCEVWVKLEQIGIESWVFEIRPFALPTCCTIIINWNVAVLPKVKWCFKLCTPSGILWHHCLIIKGTNPPLHEEIEITEMMPGLFFNFTGIIFLFTGGGASKSSSWWNKKLSYVPSKFPAYISS